MRLYRLLLLVIPLMTACNSNDMPTSDERLPIIVDADTANELDDLFALVRVLTEPTFDLRAITSAQFHTSPLAGSNSVSESQAINEELLRLMAREDVPHPIGSNEPLRTSDLPSPSPASKLMIKEALSMPEGQKLRLVILGSCTNVASAILMEPRIIPKVSVHYLGFWHDPATNIYDKKEFNSGNDPLAVDVLLDSEGLELEIMSATTSQHLTFERKNTEEMLADRGGIGTYLADRWQNYSRWWTEEDPGKTSWIMWDVAIIEALARPELARKSSFTTPPENALRKIDVFTHIDTVAMRDDFWRAFSPVTASSLPNSRRAG